MPSNQNASTNAKAQKASVDRRMVVGPLKLRHSLQLCRSRVNFARRASSHTLPLNAAAAF
jgi:hypothetical protein